MLIFDEKSMLCFRDLLDIERRLRAAQENEEDRKKLFGGLHVIFCGDFYQLPPVAATHQALYMTPSKRKDATSLNTKDSEVIRRGRAIWEQFDSYAELIKNYRWDSADSTMSTIAPIARLGEKPVPTNLLDRVNANLALNIDHALSKAHPKAMWLASTNAEVEAFNIVMTKRLIASGAPKCTIWAQHTSDRQALDEARRISLLRTEQRADSQDYYQGKGIGRSRLVLCVGSRVRLTRNICTLAGLYQGAIGTVVAFGFPPGVNPSTFSNMTIDQAAAANYSPFLVYVQLDNAIDGKNFKTCVEGLPGVVCISAIEMDTKLDGGSATRWMLPLLLAHASTLHKAQGLTCTNGVVLKPPRIAKKTASHDAEGAELGLAYVGFSRVTKLDGAQGLILLDVLRPEHFMTRPVTRRAIRREYERLRSLPNVVQPIQYL